MEQLVEHALVSSLAPIVSPGVAGHIQVASQRPSEAHDGRGYREAQASNQQGRDHGRLVLGEVCVGALSAVELVGGIVGARGRCVRCWVRYLGRSALPTSVDRVCGVDEEG